MKNAIVTTLINASSILDFFLKYHLKIGFDHIFLFFDDPLDPSILIAEKYEQVTVIPNDHNLKQKWKETKLLQSNKAYHNFINVEAMARQMLNVEVASQLSIKMEITWLLHIDIDELFYCPDESVKEHFRKLSGKGYRHITYANHEAVPESIYIDNFLQEVTLFKKNISCLSSSQIDLLHNQAAFNFGNKYFLYYSIGKSAVNVNYNLMPLSVHSFIENETNFCGNPSVLHYPVCGFDHFYAKYKTLGAFSDQWFGEVDIKNNIPFHIKCRDEIKKNSEISALNFYTKEIMIGNESLINGFIDAGLFFRVDLNLD